MRVCSHGEPSRSKRGKELTMDEWQKNLGKKFQPPMDKGKTHKPSWGHKDGETKLNTLPSEYIFKDSFYNSEGNLKQELFYGYPKEIAELFANANLKSTALRHIFGSFQRFASKLRDGRITFDKAMEQFGTFYTERIIRQNTRKDSRGNPLLPDIIVEFVNGHKDLALKDEKEMLGLFRYVTNILCYFKGR